MKSYGISENSQGCRGQRNLPERYDNAQGPWKKGVEFRHGKMKGERYQGREKQETCGWYSGLT